MSEKKSVVISGEASETDSENEVDSPSIQPVQSSVQGAIIAGEDSESQEELEDNETSSNSISSDKETKHLAKRADASDSLLHRKLRECNNNFYQDLEVLCSSNINMAIRDLSTADQQLLRSQIVLQGAVTSLKTLNSNSIILKNKLDFILSSNFLPNVNT